MVLSSLSQFISPCRKLLVGFSGGLDSTVLLHRLMLLRDQETHLKLRAIHVHHGLSPHADQWALHCRSICKIWDVPLVIAHVTLQENKLGKEGESRKARYTAFAQALLPGEVLVTAQHIDDQCETFLLALKRGSGPAGLSSMPARADFFGTLQLRPLLGVSRTSLEIWANKYDLCWVEDDSNQDDGYDRNFLRLRVLPLLMRRWPHFANATSRSAQLCAEQETLLDELLASELAEAISEEGSMTIEILKKKTPIRRAALLRRWLAMQEAIMPSRNMLMRIWDEVALAREDAKPVLHLSGFEVRRYNGQLWHIPFLPKVEDRVLYWTDLRKPLTLPHGMGQVLLQPGGEIRLPKQGEQVRVLFQARGVLHLVGRQGGRKLKKIWQERKVPPWKRTGTPLLFYGETLIAAVGGLFITQEGFAEKEGMRFTWKT